MNDTPRQPAWATGEEATTERQPGQQRETDPKPWPWLGVSTKQLLLGLLFGIAFGFLLQKGGVAKFDILIGVLLLENFTVVKVMLSAIIVGMVGVDLLHRWDVLDLQIKETIFGATIVGGLIFGVGFGLLAYCPGTNAAAVGQGNFDALVGVLGMILGSYLFALSAKFSSGTVSTWGRRGKLTFPQWLGVSRGKFIAVAAPVLVAVLIVLEWIVGS